RPSAPTTGAGRRPAYAPPDTAEFPGVLQEPEPSRVASSMPRTHISLCRRHNQRDRMATRLGDRLIAKGAITQKQLDQALNAQLIVGGHLGTCLIELGMIDESALGVALSEAFGVPHAPAEALQDI